VDGNGIVNLHFWFFGTTYIDNCMMGFCGLKYLQEFKGVKSIDTYKIASEEGF
jgi:hypothetical protein